MHKVFWKKYGKILVIWDRASQHRSKKVKEYLKNHKRDIKIRYIPVGTPCLNVVEQCWNRAKYDLMVSEYYKSFETMKSTLSEYFRTTKFGYDMYRYLYSVPKIRKDF